MNLSSWASQLLVRTALQSSLQLERGAEWFNESRTNRVRWVVNQQAQKLQKQASDQLINLLRLVDSRIFERCYGPASLGNCIKAHRKRPFIHVAFGQLRSNLRF
jgi:hypothetical protein